MMFNFSPPTNAEVKNDRSYSCTPPYASMAWMENYPFFTIFIPIYKPHFGNWLHLLHNGNRITKKRYRKIWFVWDVTLCCLVKKGDKPRRDLYTEVRSRTTLKTSVRAPNMRTQFCQCATVTPVIQGLSENRDLRTNWDCFNAKDN